ncbi:MAG TPA: FtsX-like permease family protein, partial [Gemmatimonadaceae bacterium]|nr:FtsX-like permease family protein [Gemmatimonadaceae bacterium]
GRDVSFRAMLVALVAAALLQTIDSLPPRRLPRTVAIDERLAADFAVALGTRLVLSSAPGGNGDTVIVSAIVRRRADPSEVARADYRVRMHLDELQALVSYGDRVDRFAVETRGGAASDAAIRRINKEAFGFQAYRSRDIAVETSQTFLVVRRFHRAIGVITIVASAIFLLCIMLLKVDERRRDVAALRLIGISSRTIVRSVMVEAALVAVIGSGIGVGLGWIASEIINWYYRGVYRTPLAFAIVTPGIVGLAVALSLALGLVAGLLAARRLVRQAPLLLLSGRQA